LPAIHSSANFTGFNQSQNRRAAQAAITYIYPSEWLRREAEQHLRSRLPGVTIPNGFDPAPYDFKPRDEARRILGLAADRPIIAISAHYLADPRSQQSVMDFMTGWLGLDRLYSTVKDDSVFMLSSSLRGTTSLTMPSASASRADTLRPVSRMPIAGLNAMLIRTDLLRPTPPIFSPGQYLTIVGELRMGNRYLVEPR